MKIKNLFALSIISATVVACGGSDDDATPTPVVTPTPTPTPTPEATPTPTTGVSTSIILDTSLFSTFSQISSFELVDCILSNGEDSQCYKVVYENVRETVTEICPENEGEVGGLGVYDGNTNPGIRALDDELWADFATDGYDIINDDGTINIQIPAGGPGSGFIEEGSGINGSCLDAELDESYDITYYIPAYPVKAETSSTTASLEYWGISLDGFPFAERPPGAASPVGVAIPGLDSCGGHPQPDGPYHYHLMPQVINDLLEDNDITNVSCEYIEQSNSTILGYARDGFPIYGTAESDGSEPAGLDECNGHLDVTDDFSDGIYHYHISNVLDPTSDSGYTNILPCTFGETVMDQGFSTVQ